METESSLEINLNRSSAPQRRPVVFDFADYKDFLKESFAFLQTKNPSFSESAFIQKAGFGPNSRGYLSLILRGKRNLSSKSVMGFARALKLDEKETSYFENLVMYNQADNERDKATYFERLGRSMKGRRSEAFELLKSQYSYFSHWYVVAIRELVALSSFKEDASWIASKLKGKVTKKQVGEAIDDLLLLGLLRRDEKRKLIQSNEIVRFSDNAMNYTVVNQIHRQLLERSKESLDEDNYQDRSCSSVVFACNKENFTQLREEIKEFRSQMLTKYATQTENNDTVFNLGIQLIYLTEKDSVSERRES